MVETGLDRLVVSEVLAGLPVREFRWYRGQRHYSGWYYAATSGRLVAYDSRLELARILLADFDGRVVGLAAQPFWLTGPDGDKTRRHVPDLLLLHADGLVTVVDGEGVRADGRPESGGAVRVAGYRRSHLVRTMLEPQVMAAAKDQSTIGGIEAALAGVHASDVVRPVVLHLVWSGRLTADLSYPLSAATTVRVAAS